MQSSPQSHSPEKAHAQVWHRHMHHPRMHIEHAFLEAHGRGAHVPFTREHVAAALAHTVVDARASAEEITQQFLDAVNSDSFMQGFTQLIAEARGKPEEMRKLQVTAKRLHLLMQAMDSVIEEETGEQDGMVQFAVGDLESMHGMVTRELGEVSVARSVPYAAGRVSLYTEDDVTTHAAAQQVAQGMPQVTGVPNVQIYAGGDGGAAGTGKPPLRVVR